jgi:hypothetical protein
MKTFFEFVIGAAASLLWFCLVCMFGALPVMFGIYLWNLIF